MNQKTFKQLTSLYFLISMFMVLKCDELIDEEDNSENPRTASDDIGSRTYTFVTNSVGDFLKNIGFVSNDILNSYVTFPGNTDKYIYLNETVDVFPLVYTLTGAALVAYVSAYLVSNIPLPDLKRSDDYLEELGYGLQRDLDSEYGDYYSSFELDDSFDYSYPDSFYGSASEKKETKTKPGKKRRKISKRTGVDFLSVIENRRQERQEPGFFERIADAINNLFAPRRRSDTPTLVSGFEERMRRYENYWKKRSFPNRRSSRKQERSEDSQQIGPSLPTPESQSKPGSKFYKDRMTEVYDSYYNNQ